MKAKTKKPTRSTAKKKAQKISVKAGQKSAAKRTKELEVAKPDSQFMNTESVDQAHAPGHRKMNRKESAKPTSQSTFTETRISKSNRTPLASRRIITGAAVGKTGRIVPT